MIVPKIQGDHQYSATTGEGEVKQPLLTSPQRQSLPQVPQAQSSPSPLVPPLEKESSDDTTSTTTTSTTTIPTITTTPPPSLPAESSTAPPPPLSSTMPISQRLNSSHALTIPVINQTGVPVFLRTETELHPIEIKSNHNSDVRCVQITPPAESSAGLVLQFSSTSDVQSVLPSAYVSLKDVSVPLEFVVGDNKKKETVVPGLLVKCDFVTAGRNKMVANVTLRSGHRIPAIILQQSACLKVAVENFANAHLEATIVPPPPPSQSVDDDAEKSKTEKKEEEEEEEKVVENLLIASTGLLKSQHDQPTPNILVGTYLPVLQTNAFFYPTPIWGETSSSIRIVSKTHQVVLHNIAAGEDGKTCEVLLRPKEEGRDGEDDDAGDAQHQQQTYLIPNVHIGDGDIFPSLKLRFLRDPSPH